MKKILIMPRSIWKGPFVDQSLLKMPFTLTNEEKPTKVWSRRSYILPQFVGYQFLVHNGKSFDSVLITEQMIGHKFGEFSRSRKIVTHKKK